MEIKKVNITDQDFNKLVQILDNTLSSFNGGIQSREKAEYHVFNSVSDALILKKWTIFIQSVK